MYVVPAADLYRWRLTVAAVLEAERLELVLAGRQDSRIELQVAPGVA